jgi:hypothetical protein
MKAAKLFMRACVILTILTVAVAGMYVDAQAIQYTKTVQYTTINSWTTTTRLAWCQHTFVARVDTVYMPFTLTLPTNVIADTLATVLVIETIATDSSNITWGYQYSMDNSNWSTLVTIQRDSSASTTLKITTVPLGYSVGAGAGFHPPYFRVRMAGMAAAAGGVANKIGVIGRCYVLKGAS